MPGRCRVDGAATETRVLSRAAAWPGAPSDIAGSLPGWEPVKDHVLVTALAASTRCLGCLCREDLNCSCTLLMKLVEKQISCVFEETFNCLQRHLAGGQEQPVVRSERRCSSGVFKSMKLWFTVLRLAYHVQRYCHQQDCWLSNVESMRPPSLTEAMSPR